MCAEPAAQRWLAGAERLLAPHYCSFPPPLSSQYYFFAQAEADGRLCMAEVSVAHASCRVSAVVKAGDAMLSLAFAAAFADAIAPLLVGAVPTGATAPPSLRSGGGGVHV